MKLQNYKLVIFSEFLAFWVLLMVFGGVSFAAELPLDLTSSDLPVTLQADQLGFDEQKGLYRAAGDVYLQSGPINLRADQVEYSASSGDALATGNVVVTTPEGSLRGEVVSVNLQSGLGRLDHGELFLKLSNFYLAGEQIERVDAATYRVRTGTFTVCDADDPAWKFTAEDLVVDINGYAKGRNGIFYLADVPVFYTPGLLYPVKRERKSGLLTPEFGYSEKRGAEIGLAWYWAIARNQDMTFYLDYLSELGVGQGGEYRYVFAEENTGEAAIYRISGLKNAEDRYSLEWRHSGYLPHQVRLAADVEYVDSRDYFEDFGRVADDYTKEKAASVVVLARHWDSVSLAGQLEYVQDLQQTNDATLQRLPEIHFDLLRQDVAQTDSYYGLESTATHFWRDVGARGARLTARPFVGTVFRPGSLIEVEPELGYTQRFYLLNNSPDDLKSAGTVDFSARLSTRLSRIYQPEWGGLGRIRHSVEPDINYLFVPDDSQNDLPFFDGLDQIERVNLISYGVTNRVTSRQLSDSGLPVYHEFLYARLSQEFDIEESRRDPLDPNDSRKPFSAVRLEFIARPTDRSHLDVDARFDPNSGERSFTMFNATGGINDSSGNSVTLDYRYTRDIADYASGTIDVAWMSPIFLSYLQRYDFQDKTNLEQALKLEYRAQCWSVSLVYRDRLEDSEYLVTFALSGIGQLARFGGNLGAPAATAP